MSTGWQSGQTRPGDKIKVGGIINHTRLCLVGVLSTPDRPGLVAAIFRALGKANLNVQFIVQSIDLNNESHVQFCIAMEDCERVVATLRPVVSALGAKKLTEGQPVSLISVFGPDFRERPGIAGTAFAALAAAEVNILAISTSISTVSCVIDEQDNQKAIEALNSVFALP